MQAITKSQRQDIRSLLQSDRVKQQIAIVLPKHMTADRMARVAVTAVLKTPKLAAVLEGATESKQGAPVLEAA